MNCCCLSYIDNQFVFLERFRIIYMNVNLNNIFVNQTIDGKGNRKTSMFTVLGIKKIVQQMNIIYCNEQKKEKIASFQMHISKLTDSTKLYQKEKINSQQIMPPHLKQNIITLALLAFLLCTASCSGVVDFQYTEYTQGLAQNSHDYGDFNFKPVEISPEEMQFPQAVNLIDLLNEPVSKKQDQALSSDIDSYLNDMKAMFLKLLTLTQKLSNSEDKILHFQSLINQTKPIAPSQSKIAQLEKQEQHLSVLTDKITNLDNWLRSNLSQIDQKYGDHQASEVRRIEMDFKIDWLKEKIDYLKNFEQRARLAIQRAEPDIDYNKYFTDLEQQFNNEQGLISQIDLIIQKKDRLGQLSKEKANLESSISALQLYIKDIEECNKEKQNIRNEFKNHGKINQLIYELKELKKNQEPNIYCEGVVKKLTQKIKTMVRYYAIVASCASDLQPKREDLKNEKQRLQQVDEKIAELQSLENLQDFEKVYKNQKKVIENMYSKIKQWKMKQFIHDPLKIAEIRKIAEEQLDKAIKQKAEYKEKIEGQPAQQRKTISNNIVDMIKEIRKLKYQYCLGYEAYDSLANAVWSETYRYESEVNLKNRLLKMYNEERQAYEQMYGEMIGLRAKIYDSLG